MRQASARRFVGQAQQGFSLVEILVGMFIGLIAIVVMMQVTENAEQRRRTTASGGDAQVAGSIALYNLERDIKLAGYGFGAATEMGCTVSAFDSNRPGATPSFPLVPVRIVDGGGGAPDRIEVLYGNSPSLAVAQPFSASTVASKSIRVNSTRTGLQRGDLAIVAESTGTCQLVEITDNADADGRTVNHAAGAYVNQAGTAANSTHNPAGGWLVGSASGNIYSLGPRAAPRLNAWRIENNRSLVFSDELHYADTTPADGVNDFSEVAEGIVDMQAEYGFDTDATRNYLVDIWGTTLPAGANWTRLIAIRVALLARSQQYERTNITTAAPTWNGGPFTMRNLDGTAGSTSPDSPNNWRRYRYRVYETVIPLRNMVWGTAP